MDDFNLFDFASNTWIQVRMVKERDRTKFKPKCFIENDLKTKDPMLLNQRKLQKICAVSDT